MAMKVYKYVMVKQDIVFELPYVARVLSVHNQPQEPGVEYPCLWVLVNTEYEEKQPLQKRRFIAVGTGDPIPPKAVPDPAAQFVGTSLSHQGRQVHHVFEAILEESDG